VEEGEKILFVNLEEKAWRQEELNIREEKEEKFEEIVPREYWNFETQVFNKKVFKKLPSRSKWDHAIELIPNACQV